MTRLELDAIAMRFGAEEALRDVSLAVGPGEILALLGSSGAGKSTALRIAAGIQRPAAGRVLVDGEDVTRAPAWQREAAMVFESYVLYPQLRVYDNIAFPLRAPAVRGRYGDEEVRARVQRIAQVVEIDHLLERRPAELSGGQRQRVALSRALVRDPSMFLLDEPIAHLDAKLRHWLRGELRRMLSASDAPTVWATPDGLEAMAVADRIAVLAGGRVVQHGTPREVFNAPATADAARLLGEPGMNILDGTVDERGTVHVEGHALRLDAWSAQPPAGGPVRVGVRPGALTVAGEKAPGRLPAEVLAAESGTRQTVVIARVGGQVVRVTRHERGGVRAADRIWLDWSGARVHIFSADSEGRLQTEACVDGGAALTYDSKGVSR